MYIQPLYKIDAEEHCAGVKAVQPKLKRHPYTKPFLFLFIHVAYVGFDMSAKV